MVINRTVYSSLAKFLEKKEICNTVIQGVSEIGALILTGNRTRQKEQLFSIYHFAEKRCLIPKKNWRDFSLK
jgi:NADH/NAD ratio-sensing transcriptional regulator Rex